MATKPKTKTKAKPKAKLSDRVQRRKVRETNSKGTKEEEEKKAQRLSDLLTGQEANKPEYTTYVNPYNDSIVLADILIPIRLDETYILFDEDFESEMILKYDFSYLPYTYQILLGAILKRTNQVPFVFHPDVIGSLMKEKENSNYYKKTDKEIETVYRRESTKSIRRTEEYKQMQKDVDLNDNAIRTKRSLAVKNLVNLGYDRLMVRDKIAKMIEECGSGLLGLTPTRIAEIVDEELQKDFKNRKQMVR